MTEKRRHDRIETRLPVKYRLLDSSGTVVNAGICTSVDISGGGIQIVGPAQAEQGNRLVLSVALPGELVEVEGRIKWVRELHYRRSAIGLEFDDESTARLTAILSKGI